jgi:tetratricopeptide (TPR) repeat protein
MTLEHSVTKNPVEEAKLNAALEALKAARELQRMRRTYGVNRIELLVDDVDGDWLEQWGEDEILDSEEFQEKLDFFVAIARKEEFQKDIQKIEEKISEVDREIQDFKAKFIKKIQRAYQDLPAAIPVLHPSEKSFEDFPAPLPPSLAKNIEIVISLSDLVAFQPTAEDYCRLGNAHFLEGQYKEAITAYDKSINLAPNSAEAFCNKGAALCQLKCYDEAILALNMSLQLQPTFAEAWHNRGMVLERMGNYAEAEKSYIRALQLHPNSTDTYLSLGTASYSAGNYQKALESNEQLLKIKSDSYEALNNRGTALKALGRLAEAIDSFDQALQINPNYVQALYNKGNIFYDYKRYEEAVANYDKALMFKPDFYEALVNKGNALNYLNRNEEAITSFKKVVANTNTHAFPDLHKAWEGLGIALEKLGQNEEAFIAYHKIFELQPDDAKAWHSVGVGLGRLNYYNEALMALTKAKELQPDNSAIIFHLGLVNAELKNFCDARCLYEEVIHFDPAFLDVWNGLGLLLHQQFKEYDQAILCYERAIELKPDEASPWFNKACSYSLLENVEKVIAALQRAIALDARFGDKAKTNSDFDLVRNDERFKKLLEE